MSLMGSRALLALASCVVAFSGGLLESGVASADTSLQPSDTLVREGLFVAGDLVRLEDGPSGMRDRVVETVLQRMYQNDSSLDPTSAESSVSAMETAVEGVSDGVATLAPNEQILQLLATLQQANLGTAVETAVGGVADDAMKGSVAGLPSGQYIASADSLSTLALTSFSPTTVLAKTFELAQQDPNFATVRDAEWGAASGEQLGMTIAQLEAIPVVKNDAALLSEVNTMQSGTTVEAATTDENDAVSTVQSELGDVIGQLNDSNRTQELPPEITAVDNASQSSAFDEVTIDDGTGSFDAQTGLNVLNGMLNGFVSSLTSGDPDAIAASVFTGGLTSLMPTLESVLGLGGGESADQEILDQIHQLSQQIANFENVTAQNFQIVDQNLSEILTQDSVLANKLSQVGANVANIASQLAGQQVKIDQLQADVYGVAADQDSEQLNTELNTYIGYQQQSGGQPLGQGDFLTAAGDFYTASTSALDSIALGPAYNFPSDLYTRMTNFPLAMNVDYLSQVAASLTGSPLDTSQVPNPDDWAVAARAYSELLLENPTLVTSSQLSRLQQIASEGQELMTAIGTATNDNAATGTDSVLFNALLTRYDGALTSTEQEIAKVENEYGVIPDRS